MHFAIEIKEQNGKCCQCGKETVLISPMLQWRIDYEDMSDDAGQYDDLIVISEEITANYCTHCELVTGIWINTVEPQKTEG